MATSTSEVNISGHKLLRAYYTLRCTTEVPVLVYYLLFYPPTIPWVPGNKVTYNRVRLEIESECCRIHGYI